MQEGLSVMIIGFGGTRNVDSYTFQTGRWARILTRTLFMGYERGNIPLSKVYLVGRDVDTTFNEWRDVRGVSAPALKQEIEKWKSDGIGVETLDFKERDITDSIRAYGPDRHEFDETFLKTLGVADLYVVSTSTIDKKTSKDGHFPYVDAILQSLAYRQKSQYKPVILVETPFTISSSTTQSLVHDASQQNVGLHENLIETFDPLKPQVAQFMKKRNLIPNRLVIERSDTQINMENPGPLNRAMITVRANPLWEKGIPHDILPPQRMLETIFEDSVEYRNFVVEHAVPFRGKDGRSPKYRDGRGQEWTCAVDVVMNYEAKIGNRTIPIVLTASFTRPPARKLEFYTPESDVIFYSSLPREQFRGELPRELQEAKGPITGYFAELRDGVRQLIAASAPNPLLDFIEAGVAECLGKGEGLVPPKDTLYVAQVGQEMANELQNYFDKLEKGIPYRTEYWFVGWDGASRQIRVAGITKESKN